MGFFPIKLNLLCGMYHTVKQIVKEKTTYINFLNIYQFIYMENVEIPPHAKTKGKIIVYLNPYQNISFIFLQKIPSAKNILLVSFDLLLLIYFILLTSGG